MSPETEQLLDRISKLQAKAASTTNQAEAELFAAKAAELLAKHNLDEAMLSARDAARDQGPIGRHPFGMRVPDAWRERIIDGVARLYFCRVVFATRNGKPEPHSWTFVGREHNAVVAKAMAEYLIATVKRTAREHSPISRMQKNFRKGAGDRLYNRLHELSQAQRQPTAEHGNGMALMVVNEFDQLDAYLGDVQIIKSKTHKHGAGSLAGWEQAGKIGLNTQIRETRASRMIGSAQ